VTPHENANAAPVLPVVYSTTGLPGVSLPSDSAASIIASAIRSFILPVGFWLSSFNNTVAPSRGTTCVSWTIGVSPLHWRTSR
jgi:hypothetical protein